MSPLEEPPPSREERSRRAGGVVLAATEESSAAPELLPGGLYDHPGHADLLFRHRTAGEAAFLARCWKLHSRRAVRHVCEAACGSGRLLARLAFAGYAVSGFDRNGPSVDHANRRLARRGRPESVRVGELAAFDVPERVDAVICMLNGFRHLESDRAARSHLGAVADALAPGGIYVLGLELTPPGAPPSPSGWTTVTRHGRLTLVTHLRERRVDRERRRETRRLTVELHTPGRWRRIEDTLRLRTYSGSQLLALAAGVEELELVDAADLKRLSGPPGALGRDSEDAAFVFRRR